MKSVPTNEPIQSTSWLDTREGYDRWSEFYDTEENPLVKLEERYIDLLLGDVRGRSVLDVGCGTGRQTYRLGSAGAHVTAIDFSDGMLARARTKQGADSVQFVAHDVTKPLPFQAGSFDLVTCFLVLEHISNPAEMFAEFACVCRPGGDIVVSVMHPAMTLKGVQARFIDPATGERVAVGGCSNNVSDYVMAALSAGLNITHMSEHVADEELADCYERARKYVGWPMLLLMRCSPQTKSTGAR